MNSVQLQKPDGTPVGIYACQCGLTFQDQASADNCCTCKYCQQPLEGTVIYHRACFEQHEIQTEARRMAEAIRLDTWDGWVFWEGAGYREGYFSSLEDLREWVELEEDLKLPEFVFVCAQEPFTGVDLDSVLENLTCDMFEDARDHLNGEAELEKAIVAFNDANAGLQTYYPDYTRVVRTTPITAEIR